MLDIALDILITVFLIVIICIPPGDIPPIVRKSRRNMAVSKSYFTALRVSKAVMAAIILVGVWIFPEQETHFISAALGFNILAILLLNRICLGVWY